MCNRYKSFQKNLFIHIYATEQEELHVQTQMLLRFELRSYGIQIQLSTQAKGLINSIARACKNAIYLTLPQTYGTHSLLPAVNYSVTNI